MQRSVRLKMIARAVQGSGRLQVAQLAELTGASEVTIRRDLAELERRGVIRRSAGAANRLLSSGEPLPFGSRFAEDQPRKLRIAQAAAHHVKDYDSVIIDNGTSAYAVALELAGRPITAIPLSLHAAVALGSRPGARVIVPGGPVEADTLALLGSQAVDAVRAIHADVLVLGACAISSVGDLLSESYEDAILKRAAIAAARRTLLVMTGDKFDRTASFAFGNIQNLSQVITTVGAKREVVDLLRATGVEVELVP